ncbi:hypothetical protein TTHERM_000769600 (macronuclear) [Tetrahymena thermophila SB210]|uniref:Uncharacterized protein n=1 Tax=Tetrahymena thermophila (strain SB210) TaxID=312017 RepID=W7X6C9_TETTS|nr:hypothetical protein TTHERM_000769600 [Tetrahymena thermophila SB210]EWS74935.1 hypothetical protein TTHERM_000769600 [Tetrahymena thermophila SB210]|eukprot:XP_012652524.1 hypothetical protein TTHERM_000769600 [Tetrahymena thermophila SB210]
MSLDQKENSEIKDKLFLDQKKQIDFISLTNTHNLIQENITLSSEQQKNQIQQEEDIEFVDKLYPSNLNQIDLIQKFNKYNNGVKNLNIQTHDSPSLFASPYFQGQTDSQIQSVPLLQSSTNAQISEKEYVAFDEQKSNQPENTIFKMIQKNTQNIVELDPKKLKTNGFPILQMKSTDNEDQIKISSDIRNLEQQKDISKLDLIMHTSKLNISKVNMDKTIYQEINFNPQKDEFFNQVQMFNQTVSTSRVLIEQNISSISPINTKTKKQNDEILFNQQSEHKLENKIQDLNEQNINKYFNNKNQYLPQQRLFL